MRGQDVIQISRVVGLVYTQTWFIPIYYHIGGRADVRLFRHTKLLQSFALKL